MIYFYGYLSIHFIFNIGIIMHLLQHPQKYGETITKKDVPTIIMYLLFSAIPIANSIITIICLLEVRKRNRNESL